MESRRRRPLWMMLALAGVALLLGLGVCELIYRAVRIAQYQQAVSNWNAALYLPDTASPLDFILRPNTAIDVPFFDARDQTFHLVTNADGLRGRPLASDFPGARRLLFLGDSYTLGWGLNEADPTFVQQAERILNADAGTTHVLTFNAGVPGYNTEQESYLLESLLERARFDEVVLCYVLNDAEPQALVPLKPSVTYRYTDFWMATDAAELIHKILRHDPDYISPRKNILTNDYAPSYDTDGLKWKTTRHALGRIATLCSEHEIKLTLFILPDFNVPWIPNYRYAAMHQQVQQTAEVLGISAFDLMPIFKGKQNTEYAIPGDGHPNLAAHTALAQAIAQQLR